MLFQFHVALLGPRLPKAVVANLHDADVGFGATADDRRHGSVIPLNRFCVLLRPLTRCSRKQLYVNFQARPITSVLAIFY